MLLSQMAQVFVKKSLVKIEGKDVWQGLGNVLVNIQNLSSEDKAFLREIFLVLLWGIAV